MGGDVLDGKQHMEQQQPLVEVRLNPQRVTVGQILAAEVDLQPLDDTLDPGPPSGARSFASEVLRVIAVDLGEVGAGGRLMPLHGIDDGIDALRGRRVMVHCHSGGRSARAVEIRRAAGVEAYNLRGGLVAWKASGRR